MARRLLAQLRPSDTNAATLYHVASKVSGQHEQGATGCGAVVVANTTGTAATCRIFHNRQGSTFDQETALRYDYSVPANQSRTIPVGALVEATERIGVRSGTSSALTFSYYAESA